MAILQGYLIGLSFAIFLGPVFFTLLQSTLQRGRLSGMMVALGILTSDMIGVFVCLLAIGVLTSDALASLGIHITQADIESSGNRFYIGLAGSVILCTLGFSYLLKPNIKSTKVDVSFIGLLGAFTKGFLVNFVNPFVFAVWTTVITNAATKFGYGNDLYLYISGSFLGILTTDMLKVLLADKLKPLLNPQILLIVFRVIGLLLVASGGYVLFYIFTKLG